MFSVKQKKNWKVESEMLPVSHNQGYISKVFATISLYLKMFFICNINNSKIFFLKPHCLCLVCAPLFVWYYRDTVVKPDQVILRSLKMDIREMLKSLEQ